MAEPLPKNTADKMIAVAYHEVGTIEGPRDNETKYGAFTGANFHPWCGSFIMWCAAKAGVKIPNTVYTPAGADGFKKKKAWYTWKTGVGPEPGDIIYFDFPLDGINRISHVGLVVKTLSGGRVLTIEGNTTGGSGDQRNGGEVCVKVRKKTDIVGWGRPKYIPGPITTKVPQPK